MDLESLCASRAAWSRAGKYYRTTFAISQSEAVPRVLISCDIKSPTRYGYDVMVTWPNLGWPSSTTYKARLVSPWALCLDYVP